MDQPGKNVLILGVSSGFGAAIARSFAARGTHIWGVHLDRRGAMPKVRALQAELEATGVQVRFFNENAADDTKRRDRVADIAASMPEGQRIDVFVHSLAFGTLKVLVDARGDTAPVTRKQLDMTLDVMAHSLVYWSQDLVAHGLLGQGGRIFSLTSSGSHSAFESYGPVAAAKAALEAHTRQLALELAPLGVTANAIMAGVTRTPALEKIPGHEILIGKAVSKNPYDRLTRPEDVAECLVELSRPGTYWMTGNTIRVDGGEDSCA